MSGARLLDPVPHVDPALAAGEAIAARAIDAIKEGATDPDLLMRVLLRILADNGYVVPPTSLLRGFCAAFQREIGGRNA